MRKHEGINMVRVEEKEYWELICDRAAQGERVVFSHNGVMLALIPKIDLELLEDLEDKDDSEAVRAAFLEMEKNNEKPIPLVHVLNDLRYTGS